MRVNRPHPMKPPPHFLTIRWDATAGDGTPVTLQATLCKSHRQVVALSSTSAQGVSRQFGESCDLCEGREPRTLTVVRQQAAEPPDCD